MVNPNKVCYLLHEKNQNFSEDLNKVNEKVQRMCNEVLVSVAGFSDDHLGVKHDEATEDSQSNPEVSLIVIFISSFF